jgi:biopolymer transport protein ExbB
MENEWSLIGLFELGGVFMWPLLAFSVATLALVVERIVYLFWHNMRVADMKNEVIGLIEEGKIDEAINGLRAQPRKNTSASILLAVAQSADRGETRMEKAAEAEAQERIRRCENGFNYLTALASLSPLTGFLGTVSGMIGAFKSIASATEVNAQLVANGIYEALITTVFGLIIAIVALSAYNILVQRVDTFAAEVTKAVSDMVSAILRTQERDGAKT